MKIGIIGCGYWGSNYIRIFNELPDSNVVWVSDLKKENLIKIKHYPNTKKTTDYKDMLREKGVDAVVVSTPASTHFEICKESLLSGKHVLVEKPITTDSKDAEELIRISEMQKRKLMVCHTFEYNPGIIALKNYIKEKILGDIFYISAKRTGLGPIRSDVNALWDLAPHDISITNYLLGSIPETTICTGMSYLQEGVEDVVFLNLKYPKNILCSVEISWLNPRKIRETVVVGSKKMAVFDDVNKNETLKIFDKGAVPFGTRDFSDYSEHQLLIRDGDVLIPKVEQSEPLKNQCKEFLDSIKNDRKPKTDGRSGLSIVRVLEAAQKSLDNKGIEVNIHVDS
jgi:predicted dehydrogenase